MHALSQAIRDASRERLEEVLKNLIERCSEAVPILAEELLVDDFNSSSSEAESETNDDCEEAPELPSKKRKRAVSQSNATFAKRKLWETCVQCESEYNVAENTVTSWHYHTGMFFSSPCQPFGFGLTDGMSGVMQEDEEFWVDHNPDVYGEIEDLKDEYPEGFTWSCCEKTGEEAPKDARCQESRHRRQ